MGYAMLGTAVARGDGAAIEAARQAINSPLLEDSRIAGSSSILINITGSNRLGLHDVNEACSIVREAAECDDVQISFGVILDESMEDSVKVTVIATGFRPRSAPAVERFALPEVKVETRAPEPEPEPEPVMERQPDVRADPEPEPEALLMAEADPIPEMDMDDLDTPAYLRQGRLLN
jgi:cell division protein FtsZ